MGVGDSIIPVWVRVSGEVLWKEQMCAQTLCTVYNHTKAFIQLWRSRKILQEYSN
jgi:hypothetical protein